MLRKVVDSLSEMSFGALTGGRSGAAGGGVAGYSGGGGSADGAAAFRGRAPPSRAATTSALRGEGSGNYAEMEEQTAEERVMGFYGVARDFIRLGLDSEQSNPAKAVERYSKAVEALEEGLAVRVPPLSARRQQLDGVRQRMERWLEQITGRIAALAPAAADAAGSSSPVPPSSLRSSWASLPSALSKPDGGGGGQVPPGALTAAATAQRAASGAAASTAPPRRDFGLPPTSSLSEAARAHLRGVDAKLVEMVEAGIVDRVGSVAWDDIAGLETAKQALMETVILPVVRADIFTGLRAPARGILLYGPPGTGKTMLARAVASAAAATFFNMSAASLTSKWVGEAEKLVRALFAVARARQPSVIFIDEVDSILSSRSAGEHESSRRLKTEFLVQFDGLTADSGDRVVVMAATNRPEELDDAARRRLPKRIYIPLPDRAARLQLLRRLLRGLPHRVSAAEAEIIVDETDGFSGSDFNELCREAAMVPIRELGSRVATVPADRVRPLVAADFVEALRCVKPSVSREQLAGYEQWTRQFGTV